MAPHPPATPPDEHVTSDGLPQHLSARLHALAASLAARDDTLGLLGLGSIGLESARADAWSDLDFFVLLRPGAKPRYLAQLDWLAAAHPLAWAFANTADGFKALMADGLMCEFAVFEPAELPHIAFAPGRWIWRREAEVPEAWGRPVRPPPMARPREWLTGEALSNLIVGLQRWHRGERMTAMRMVQVFAVDRIIEVLDGTAVEADDGGAGSVLPLAARDAFSPERRVEARHPSSQAILRAVAPGVDHTPAAALALLAALERLVPVPPAAAARVRELAR